MRRLARAGTCVATVGLAVALGGCMRETPIAQPSASVEAATLVQINGYVSYPCQGFRPGAPSGVRIVFKTHAGTLLGKATTGQTRFTTRADGRCAQQAPYSIALPRRPTYVARDPIQDQDVLATLQQLVSARFRWDFRYGSDA